MRMLSTIVLTVALVACSGKVQVMDPAGKPVAGAQVAPVSLSINGAPVTTDARGEASVPLSLGGQQIQWMNISKAGFESQHLSAPAKWPLKVVLSPAMPR